MKKIALVLLLVAGFLFNQSANAQRTRYYYYPDQNVYYNPGTHEYSYSDNGNWQTNRQLPRTVMVDRHARRVTVYHNTPDVWSDNEMHRKKYWRHREHDRDDHHDRDRH